MGRRQGQGRFQALTTCAPGGAHVGWAPPGRPQRSTGRRELTATTQADMRSESKMRQPFSPTATSGQPSGNAADAWKGAAPSSNSRVARHPRALRDSIGRCPRAVRRITAAGRHRRPTRCWRAWQGTAASPAASSSRTRSPLCPSTTPTTSGATAACTQQPATRAAPRSQRPVVVVQQEHCVRGDHRAGEERQPHEDGDGQVRAAAWSGRDICYEGEFPPEPARVEKGSCTGQRWRTHVPGGLTGCGSALICAVSVHVPCVGVLRTAVGRPAHRRRRRHRHRPARTG